MFKTVIPAVIALFMLIVPVISPATRLLAAQCADISISPRIGRPDARAGSRARWRARRDPLAQHQAPQREVPIAA